MKKTKAVKLVLITGLIGAGHTSFANVPKLVETRNVRGTIVLKKGYYFTDDSLRAHSGSSSFAAHNTASRGGWGGSGHTHSSAS
jgi:uridine kinase